MSNDAVPNIALPDWFDEAFGHLQGGDRAEVEALWRDEPALRTLALLLDALRPNVKRFRPCPRCGHDAPLWRQMHYNAWSGHCPACDAVVSTAEGSPFKGIYRRNWPRLYATLVLEWGPWSPWHAWRRVRGCTHPQQFRLYRKRLRPLFDELPADMPQVSRLRYRLGFAPAEQGMRCPHCGSDDLKYEKRQPADKARILCQTCRRTTAIATRVVGLPLPEEACCPSCGGRRLFRRTRTPDGRNMYGCHECGRYFTEHSKKFQPSRTQPTPPTQAGPPGLNCPTCGRAEMRVKKILADGRRRFCCVRCHRTFVEHPKHPATRTRPLPAGLSSQVGQEDGPPPPSP